MLCPPSGMLQCRGGFDGKDCSYNGHVNLHSLTTAAKLHNLHLDHTTTPVNVITQDWANHVNALALPPVSWRSSHDDPQKLMHLMFGVLPAELRSGMQPAAVVLRCWACHKTFPHMRAGKWQ